MLHHARLGKSVSGSGWESNPPNAGLRRSTGFEDRDGHQSRIRSLKLHHDGNLAGAGTPFSIDEGDDRGSSFRQALENSFSQNFVIVGKNSPQVNQNAAIVRPGHDGRASQA